MIQFSNSWNLLRAAGMGTGSALVLSGCVTSYNPDMAKLSAELQKQSIHNDEVRRQELDNATIDYKRDLALAFNNQTSDPRHACALSFLAQIGAFDYYINSRKDPLTHPEDEELQAGYAIHMAGIDKNMCAHQKISRARVILAPVALPVKPLHPKIFFPTATQAASVAKKPEKTETIIASGAPLKSKTQAALLDEALAHSLVSFPAPHDYFYTQWSSWKPLPIGRTHVTANKKVKDEAKKETAYQKKKQDEANNHQQHADLSKEQSKDQHAPANDSGSHNPLLDWGIAALATTATVGCAAAAIFQPKRLMNCRLPWRNITASLPSLAMGMAIGGATRYGVNIAGKAMLAKFGLAAIATTMPGVIAVGMLTGAIVGGVTRVAMAAIFKDKHDSRGKKASWWLSQFCKGAAFGAGGFVVGGVLSHLIPDGFFSSVSSHLSSFVSNTYSYLFNGHPPVLSMPSITQHIPAATTAPVPVMHASAPVQAPAALPAHAVAPVHAAAALVVSTPAVHAAASTVAPLHTAASAPVQHTTASAPVHAATASAARAPVIHATAPAPEYHHVEAVPVRPGTMAPAPVINPADMAISSLVSEAQMKMLPYALQKLAESQNPHDILRFTKDASDILINGKHHNEASVKAGVDLLAKGLKIAANNHLHSIIVEMLNRDMAYMLGNGHGIQQNIISARVYQKAAGALGKSIVLPKLAM